MRILATAFVARRRTEHLAKARRDEFAKWSRVIKEAGVKPQ